MPVKSNTQLHPASITKTQPTDISSFRQKFRVHFAGMMSYGRQTVSEGYFAGQALAEIKKRLPHGAWLDFLDAEGLNREMARKLRRLGSELEIANIVQFASIESAYKSLPPRTPNRLPPDPSEPPKDEQEEILREINVHYAQLEKSEAEVGEAIYDALDDGHSVNEMCDSGAIPFGREEAVRFKRVADEAAGALALEKKRSAEVYQMLTRSKSESQGRKRKLNAVKLDLVDGKPVEDILAQHYGVAVQTNLGVKDRG